jgi:hypothetical protein
MTSRCCWFTQPAGATRTNGSGSMASMASEAAFVGYLGPAGSEKPHPPLNSRSVVASVRFWVNTGVKPVARANRLACKSGAS